MMKQKMYSTQFLSMIAKKQKEAVAEEAIENGLLSEAATKTQSTIKKYLNAIPGIDGNYEIKVKFLETKKES